VLAAVDTAEVLHSEGLAVVPDIVEVLHFEGLVVAPDTAEVLRFGWLAVALEFVVEGVEELPVTSAVEQCL
jgi:hypothetical protein